MAQPPNMNLSAEEDDPRSIKIRRGYKPLREYFNILSDTDKKYGVAKIEIFDDIFQSFLNEEDYETSLAALKFLFQKIEFYDLELANCKIAFNIGKLLDCFLTKFKHRLNELDKNNLHAIVTNITSDSFMLHNLKDTEYIIALIFLKHYDPVLYKQEEREILNRFDRNDLADNCVKQLIEDVYKYPNEKMNQLLYFQTRIFVLIRNSMMITEDFIEMTRNVLLSEDYRENWITIFACKMLSHVIVPLIAYKENKINLDEIQIDDGILLNWLLEFSERSFGNKLRPDKWESVNDEDFALTWKFLKEHASNMQRRNFYKFLIDNGFEFHLSDPHSESCFKGVKRN